MYLGFGMYSKMMMFSRTEQQNIVQEFHLDPFNEFRFGVKHISDFVQLEVSIHN